VARAFALVVEMDQLYVCILYVVIYIVSLILRKKYLILGLLLSLNLLVSMH
jgi:hypothetical protein